MRFYKFSCVAMAVVFVIVLILTLLSNQTHYKLAQTESVTRENCVYYYVHVDKITEADGSVAMPKGYVMVADYLSILYRLDPAEAARVESDYRRIGPFYETYLLFDGVVLYVLLGVMALLLLVCVCISQIYGTRTYKIGFFVLHGGLVVLLIGFIFQNILAQSISVVLDVGKFPTGESTVYTDVDDNTNSLDLGVQLYATDMQVTYYPETEMVKEYDLTLQTVRGMWDNNPITYKLRVNEPIRINGHKIYLMNYSQGSVLLLVKYNPLEYTILLGMLTTLAGAVIMCLFRKDGGKQDE